MYFGAIVIMYSMQMIYKFRKLDEIFDRIDAVDREIVKLLGNNEKIRKSEHIQFHFEFCCVAAITISFIVTSIYDIWIYPP